MQDVAHAWWQDYARTAVRPEGNAPLTSPGLAPVSAWKVIAVATPWAVGPPVVALILGASLFWAFAGSRRSAR
jgi:hypothetical protein